jgi:hypothetical protein
LKISIIGIAGSGKTTVFNTLTLSNISIGTYASGSQEPNVAVVKVPDERVEKLAKIFNPKKKTPAEITFFDYAGIVKSPGKKKSDIFSEEVKQSDALVLVIRVFEDESIPHPYESVNPLRDAEVLNLELIMNDLGLVETRLERLQKDLKSKKTPQTIAEAELMEKIKSYLENEKPLRMMNLTDEERKILRGYCFLSQKPTILLANIGEEQLSGSADKELEEYAKNTKMDFISFCGKIEMEISRMEPEEQKEFLKEYNINKPAKDFFIRKAYKSLGLISFFTVGEDEVKAWTIKKGTDAPNAAGVIHSDLQRGFIRAETVGYEDFIQLGCLIKTREKGLMRQEGKTYIVKDGDIINIKFNV